MTDKTLHQESNLLTKESECHLCGFKVESINDLTLCGHCKKQSCPNCGSPIDLGVIILE